MCPITDAGHIKETLGKYRVNKVIFRITVRIGKTA